MKKKISITLSRDLRAEIDRLIVGQGSRSAFIEKVLSEHFKELAEHEIPATEKLQIDTSSAR
jgi:metal-responsive CopG/Arc/MetJ family transcriptional regulator